MRGGEGRGGEGRGGEGRGGEGREGEGRGGEGRGGEGRGGEGRGGEGGKVLLQCVLMCGADLCTKEASAITVHFPDLSEEPLDRAVRIDAPDKDREGERRNMYVRITQHQHCVVYWK